MKIKLTIQSLAPLFVLLLIQNVGRWNKREEYNNFFKEFLCDNWYVILTEVVLGIFVILAIIFYFTFKKWGRYGQETHKEILELKNINEQSLIFFVTYILPIVVCDFLNARSLICCLLIIAAIMWMMCKTDMYYQNPILSWLNYNIYSIKIENMEFVAIVKGTLKERDFIRKKEISNNVYMVRRIKNG